MISDLRQSLDRLDDEIRTGVLPHSQLEPRRTWIFREYLQRERNRLKYEHEAGATGRHVVQQWTSVVDALVTEAYRMVILDNDELAGDCAIVAQGGYGRGHLNVWSDVDLLFLFRGELPKESPIVKGVLGILWDLDFDLGHATRSIDNALSFAAEDEVTLTALIDARFLAGYAPAYRDFVRRYRDRFLGDHGHEFAERKAGALVLRRATHGGHAQVLEPDVKESAGGLRDLHTIQWVMNARHGSGALDALVEHHVLPQRDLRTLENAVDFIWRVRNDLHFLQKRKHDKLTFDKQPVIAERFGYRDSTRALAVEQFMRDYYTSARDVVRLSDTVCHALTRRVSRATQVADIVRRRTLADGSILVRGKILLPARRAEFFRDDPKRLMSIFGNMHAHKAVMSATASRHVQANLSLVDDDYRRDPRVAEAFRSMMSRAAYLPAVLREMHYAGLLGRYIPEFGRLTCLVQHDYYHAFTADEHSIVTLERIEGLATGQDTRMKDAGSVCTRVAEVYRGIADKEALHLATLLHDVGKSGGHGHAERGAEMSVEIAERLGLSKDRQDLIAFLVAHHLDLSHVSERRDLSDTAMLQQVAGMFNDATSLDMLYVLTWADMNATQAERVTTWKCELLHLLFTRLRGIIAERSAEPGAASSDDDEMVSVLESPTKFEDRLAKLTGPEVAERHMAGMPRRYSLLYSLEEAASHAERAEQVKADSDVVVTVSRPGSVGTVTVFTRDRSQLLSDICGVLTVNDLDIHGADAFTRTDGVIVDVFTVRGLSEDAGGREAQEERLRKNFLAVWKGEEKVDSLIQQHRRRWARRKVKAAANPSRVVFDNETSEHFTVVDVFATDRLGLLYDISKTISEAGLDIHMARIGTDADQVADAFYVTDASGRKLADDDPVCDSVRNTLLEALDGERA